VKAVASEVDDDGSGALEKKGAVSVHAYGKRNSRRPALQNLVASLFQL
jgi:hypothetical protein